METEQQYKGDVNMKNLIKRDHHLIMEGKDVLNTLSVINKHHKRIPKTKVGSYELEYENKWFIHFTTSIDKWDDIRKELNVIRVFDFYEIPKNCEGKVYTTD